MSFLDKGLTDFMIETFKGQSVVELGAGIGQYSTFLNPHTSYIVPYDGAFRVEDATHGFVSQLDLSKPQDVGVFDWVLSLEVGEHIPK